MRREFFGLLGFLLLLTACGGPANPTYPSPQRAIEGWQNTTVQVLQDVPSGDDHLMIFRSTQYPAPLLALVEYAGRDRWRPWYGMDQVTLRNIGPVSFHRKGMGRVAVVKGEPPNSHTDTYAKTLVFYGVVNDPRITWVELTLIHDPTTAHKAPVVNGTWLVQWPDPHGLGLRAALRAGDNSGELFAFPDVETAPEFKEQGGRE